MSLNIEDEQIIQYIKMFGDDINQQLDICQEECAELIQAIGKRKRNGDQTSLIKVSEEMTHVLISINIIAKLLGITQKHIDAEVKRKSEIYGFFFLDHDL